METASAPAEAVLSIAPKVQIANKEAVRITVSITVSVGDLRGLVRREYLNKGESRVLSQLHREIEQTLKRFDEVAE